MGLLQQDLFWGVGWGCLPHDTLTLLQYITLLLRLQHTTNACGAGLCLHGLARNCCLTYFGLLLLLHDGVVLVSLRTGATHPLEHWRQQQQVAVTWVLSWCSCLVSVAVTDLWHSLSRWPTLPGKPPMHAPPPNFVFCVPACVSPM